MVTETEDLAKLAVGGRMLRNGRIRRALIARLLSEQAEASDDEGDEDTTDEGGDDDRQLVRAIIGSRALRRRRLRRVLLAHLIKERAGGEDDVDEGDEDIGEETGEDDRQLVRLIVGSRILRRRRVRRALIAKLIRARGEEDDEFDDDVDEGDEDIDEGGSDRDRKFLRLLVASRVLRRRRVRRALIAKLLKERGEGEEDVDEFDEDDVDDEGPDVERQVARLLVGGRVVRRRRARRAALVRFLRNRE